MPRFERLHHARLLLAVPWCLVASRADSQATGDTTLAIVSGPSAMRADSLLRALQSQGFSGVALVAKDGRVTLKKGYGLANRAAGVPFTGASVVQIGSNTKDFTIVAILQLMERGKLSLSDPITNYFRDVPDDKRAITIDQLLKHQAGFDQHLGGDFEVVSRDQEIAHALSARLLFPPGTDRKYSNIGYSLLAAIIEIVSGSSYDDYVRASILDPLGLHDTGLLLPHFAAARVAHGYAGGEDRGTFLERPLAPDGPYWNLRGNGGMLSTVSDMYRFYRALLSDRPPVKPASRDLFFRPDGQMVLAGSDLTFFFFYSHYPIAGFDIILSSNSTDYPAPKARQQLGAVLGVEPPPGARADDSHSETVIDTTPSGSAGARRGGIGRRDAAGLDAPVSLPETPAGRAARRFLQVYLDADTIAIRRLLELGVIQSSTDHRTIGERVAGFKMMHDDLGFLTPVEIVSSTEHQVVFRARSVQAGVVTFTIGVEGSPPFRITQLRVERT